jgi:hypothetical protein
MIYTFFSIPTGYILSIFINDFYNFINSNNFNNSNKYIYITTITSIIFLSVLRDYTGNDLITNINEIIDFI